MAPVLLNPSRFGGGGGGGGGGTAYTNHVTIKAPGTHGTIDPANPTAAGASVISGAGFTPTAGRMLVCFVGGPVTTSTPTGWTAGANSVNTQGLYSFYKTAAGSDTLAGISHSGTTYPITFDIYEFASGSSYLGGTGGRTTNGAIRSLGGLTGTSTVLSALGGAFGAGAFNMSGAASIVDYSDGAGLHYACGSTDNPNRVPTVAVSSIFEDHERVMVAIGTAGSAPPATAATTWDFRSLSVMPAGWVRRGITTAETLDAAGMQAAYAAGQGHQFVLGAPVSSGLLEVKLVADSSFSTMVGPIMAKAGVQSATASWYTSPSGALILGASGSYAYDGAFANAGGSPAVPAWFRVRLAAAVAYGSYSLDGTTWSSEVSIARASMTTIDEISIGASLNGATVKTEYVKWTP